MRLISGHLKSLCENEKNTIKVNAFEIATPIIEAVSSVAKTIICAIGSLFQAAKTLIKLPFAIVLAPLAYVLEKVGKYLKEDAVIEFARGMSPNFLKELFMTVHLVGVTFSDKMVVSDGELRNSTVKDVLNNVYDIVSGADKLYDLPASVLWDDYINGAEREKAKKFEATLAKCKASPKSEFVKAPEIFQEIIKNSDSNDPEETVLPVDGLVKLHLISPNPWGAPPASTKFQAYLPKPQAE